jgi:hypothetical protein
MAADSLPKLVETFLEDIGPIGVEYVNEYRKDTRIEDAQAWKRMKDRWDKPRQYDDISDFVVETLDDPVMFNLLHFGGSEPIRYFFNTYLANRGPFEIMHILDAIRTTYDQTMTVSSPNKCVVS